MHTDLSFITNEQSQSLKDSFQVLIRSTDFFDCLVGYFYASGFHAIYRALENSLEALTSLGEELLDPMKVLVTLHKNIPERLLQSHFAEQGPAVSGRREIILSMYLNN
jgi:hypothetical protein